MSERNSQLYFQNLFGESPCSDLIQRRLNNFRKGICRVEVSAQLVSAKPFIAIQAQQRQGFAKMLSIIVSTLTIITQMALSHVIRMHVASNITHDLIRGAVLELIASAEMCGTCFELVIIADNYGVGAYAVYLFFMTIWWGQSWGPATACPYSLLEDYVESGSDPKEVATKVAAQVVGGIASFRWVKKLWVMELAATHVGRGVDACSADLQVPVLYGFLIELLLTCACRLVSRGLGELEPKYASSIESFFATSMVVLAFNYSGGYFNPVLATGLKWGCRGHTHFEHVVVYWAGSILGSMVSMKLWSIGSVKQTLLRPFQTKPVKEEKTD
ncbi:Aquaporin-like [Trinorchestia longiramus]|nr:Aquaporin-like [Trinorchestia longiramus]